MKISFFAVFFVVFITSCSTTKKAGLFEGTIKYELSYPEMDNPGMAAMLPSETTIYYKGSKQRMEQKMAMGMSTYVITDMEKEQVTVLMDMMGKKFAMDQDFGEAGGQDTGAKLKSVDSKPSKVIAGYNCIKAVFETEDGSTFDVYFTKELGTGPKQKMGPFKEIDGLMMQFNMDQNGMKIELQAEEVKKEVVSDTKFIIPEGYKKTTPEELQKIMMGG